MSADSLTKNLTLTVLAVSFNFGFYYEKKILEHDIKYKETTFSEVTITPLY